MDSSLTKATTLLFLVATFCLAVLALAEDDDGHPVTVPVHPPNDSPLSPLTPSSVDPPADSPVSHPLPPSINLPSDSPVIPPLPPPVDPPAQPPMPRRPEPRGIVSVKGIVFCQSCKHAGSDDLTRALPINDAVVKVQCKINETVIEMTTRTFGYGFFFLQQVNVNDFGNCKAYLVSSPQEMCNTPTDLHGGITGGKLKWHKPPYLRKPYHALFLVKPFAFLPKCT